MAHYSYDSAQADRWETDSNGFMRTTVRLIATGIMDYAGNEIMETLPGDEVVPVFVPHEAISDPYTARSVEGMPVMAGQHVWIEPNGDRTVEVGSVAGSPRVDGPYLVADIVVRDAETIDKIKSGELRDISAGYLASYAAKDGEYEGVNYRYVQSGLRFNHVAILPPGEGRGGRHVRILNNKPKAKENEQMAVELTRVRVGNSSVHVANQDVPALETEMAEKELASANQIEAVMKELADVKAQVAELNAKKAELEGQVAAYKEQLEAALAPESVEAEAEKIANERDEAAEMLVKNQAEEDKEKAMNSLKGKRGHDLRKHVLNAIRTKNGKPAIDEKASEDFVKGQFDAMKTLTMVQNKATAASVVGASKVMNAAANPQQKSDPLGFAKYNEFMKKGA